MAITGRSAARNGANPRRPIHRTETTVADLWSEVLFVLGEHRPHITFEERVTIAEHAAREVDDLAPASVDSSNGDRS